MARLPESRVKARLSTLDAARTFVDHSITGLKTVEVVFPSVSRKDKTFVSYNEPHVGPRPTEWTSKTGDCLHCCDALEDTCVPIAKYKLDDSFWVFGQFCSPECALGYVREGMLGAQVQTWTTSMLAAVFKCPLPITSAPPRFMLRRFGGSLETDSWRRTSCTSIKYPPLCTFAMFAECMGKPQVDAPSGFLTRPTERDTMPAIPTATGREPVILRILATGNTPEVNPKSPKRAVKRSKKTSMLL